MRLRLGEITKGDNWLLQLDRALREVMILTLSKVILPFSLLLPELPCQGVTRLKISYPCPKGSNLRPCRTICCMVKSEEAGAKAESPPTRPRIPPRGDMPSAVDDFSEYSEGIGENKKANSTPAFIHFTSLRS